VGCFRCNNVSVSHGSSTTSSVVLSAYTNRNLGLNIATEVIVQAGAFITYGYLIAYIFRSITGVVSQILIYVILLLDFDILVKSRTRRAFTIVHYCMAITLTALFVAQAALYIQSIVVTIANANESDDNFYGNGQHWREVDVLAVVFDTLYLVAIIEICAAFGLKRVRDQALRVGVSSDRGATAC
jgi:hypothetical protein